MFRQKTVVNVCGQLTGEGCVNSTALERSANMDDELRFVTHFMFDHFQSLVLNCKLYLKGDMAVRSGAQISFTSFQNPPDSFVAMFKTIRSPLFRPNVIELDEVGMSVSQAIQQGPLLTPVHAKRKILHPDVG